MKVADVIKKRKEEIIDKWVNRLSDELAVVHSMDDAATKDSMPELLESLAEALLASEHKEVVFHSRHHGRQRTEFKGYTLANVIREYHLLRNTIFEVLDEYDGIHKNERDTIIYVIDQAIEQAANTFHRISHDVLTKGIKLAEQKADMLNVVDQNREEFIMSLSHDLNNPLNNIQAGINLLEQDPELHEIESIIEIIRSSVKRATHLLEDLLDTGTVSVNDSLPVKRKRANLTKDLKEECVVFELIYKRKIDFPRSENDVIADVDLDLIRRAFTNLLNNALKHSHSESKITAFCEYKDETITIGVSNEGSISSGELDRIFKRYYQSDGGKVGWGIGLSFVKQVAEAHGGRVEVKNAENQVSFYLVMPA